MIRFVLQQLIVKMERGKLVVSFVNIHVMRRYNCICIAAKMLPVMLPEFFGGEGGVTANRYRHAAPGHHFGPQIQVYYLIAVWCLLCMAAMYAFTRTPLGRMSTPCATTPSESSSSATRHRGCASSPSGLGLLRRHGRRAGGDPLRDRHRQVVGAARSGLAADRLHRRRAFFFGPIIGAVLMMFVLCAVGLHRAWQLYVGVMFVLMVMYAPGGVGGLMLMHLRWRAPRRAAAVCALDLAPAAAMLFLAGGRLVEMGYHLLVKAAEGPAMRLFGVQLDTSAPTSGSASSCCCVGRACSSGCAGRSCVNGAGRRQNKRVAEMKHGDAP